MIAATYHPAVASACGSVAGAVLLQYLVEQTIRNSGPIKAYLRPNEHSHGLSIAEALAMSGRELDMALAAVVKTVPKSSAIDEAPGAWCLSYRSHDGLRVFDVNLAKYAATVSGAVAVPSIEGAGEVSAYSFSEQAQTEQSDQAGPVLYEMYCPECMKVSSHAINPPSPRMVKLASGQTPSLVWDSGKGGGVKVLSRSGVSEVECPHCGATSSLVLMVASTGSFQKPIDLDDGEPETESWRNVRGIIEENGFRNLARLISRNPPAHKAWDKVWKYGRERVFIVLMNMDSRATLLKDYKNAASTAYNWLRLEDERKKPVTTQPPKQTYNGR